MQNRSHANSSQRITLAARTPWKYAGNVPEIHRGIFVEKPKRTPPVPLASQGRHSAIQEHLKQYIIENRLKPGDQLPPEENLVEQLGVSRSALREALRSMEALGIIATQHGVGRVVLPFSFASLLNNLSFGLQFHDQNILQIAEIRKALDAYFIEPAVRNIGTAEITALAELVEKMRKNVEAGNDIREEDLAFHRLLFSCCGNDLAYELFEVTWKASRAAYSQDRMVAELPPGTYEDHKALLEAIIARDIEEARRIIVAHHWNFERRFGKET